MDEGVCGRQGGKALHMCQRGFVFPPLCTQYSLRLVGWLSSIDTFIHPYFIHPGWMIDFIQLPPNMGVVGGIWVAKLWEQERVWTSSSYCEHGHIEYLPIWNHLFTSLKCGRQRDRGETRWDRKNSIYIYINMYLCVCVWKNEKNEVLKLVFCELQRSPVSFVCHFLFFLLFVCIILWIGFWWWVWWLSS